MAIDYCHKHDLRFDRDWFAECPQCSNESTFDCPVGLSVDLFATQLAVTSRIFDRPAIGIHNGRALRIKPGCTRESIIAQWDKIGHAIAVEDERKRTAPIDLIRKLMDRFPFDASSRDLHDECKRVLGEA